MNIAYILRVFLGGCSVVYLAGCANDFATFYRPVTTASSEDIKKLTVPYSGKTQVLLSQNLKADGDDLARKGYVALGISEFRTSKNLSQSTLLSYAQKIGADVVLFSSQYLGSQQGIVPVPIYHSGQTYTTETSGNHKCPVISSTTAVG